MKMRIAVAAVTAVVVLVVAEMSLRAWAPLHFVGIRRAHQYDAELGVRIRPGIHLFDIKDYQEEIRTNSLGTVNFEDSFGGYRLLGFASRDPYPHGNSL